MRETSGNKQILITVKADPNPSKEYGETVCCAGIDLSNYQFIRLYPIPFRYLEDERQFKKYAIIEADCFRSNDDKRPESFMVNCASIKILEFLETAKEGWKKRKDIFLRAPIKSMCQVIIEAENSGLSLGIIKPENVSFDYTRRRLPDPKIREAYYNQLNLLKKHINAIEAVPFQFYYIFRCTGVEQCPGHDLPIVDWEINQAYRNWRKKYATEKELLEKIAQRWLEISDPGKKDVYFYVGNRKLNKKTFMVLGVFWPPLNE
jgi:hypothetical protein